MPFLFDAGDGMRLLFSRKQVVEPSFWEIVYAPFDLISGVDVDRARVIQTGLSDQFHKCSAMVYRRAADNQLVLTFVAGSPEGRYHPYQMIGSSLDGLGQAERVNPLGLRPWTMCENNLFRVVGGVLSTDLTTAAEVHVMEFESGQVFAIQNPFTWVYRVATDPLDESKLYICGQMSEDRRDIVTVAYDLRERKLLGLLEINGKSVYKPCVYDNRLVAYAMKGGIELDDRYLEWADEFQIVPMEGTRDPVFVADNGDKVNVRAIDFHDRPAVMDQRCHWKMRGRWFCTKFQKMIDEPVCRACGVFDSAAPIGKDVEAVNLAHMVAAVTLDRMVGPRPVQNVVDRGVAPPSTISFIENPFFESETCKSGMFCASCRAEGQAGEAFRAQVGIRWGLPKDFPCPYVVEGCEYRGEILSVENKSCCGGKIKTVKTYKCLAGLGGGAVTIDNCLVCPVRNRRRVGEKIDNETPATVSPWGDPARRLLR